MFYCATKNQNRGIMDPHDNASSHNQWDDLPSHSSYPDYNQDEEGNFGFGPLLEFPDFDDNAGISQQTGLLDPAIDNWEYGADIQEVAPPWNSVMTFRTHPAPEFPPAASNVKTAMHSPADATDSLERTPIAHLSAGRGTQSVFRAVDDVPRGSKQHPAEVWESHKAEIRRLYIDQQKTLREVTDIMAQRGFRAT